MLFNKIFLITSLGIIFNLNSMIIPYDDYDPYDPESFFSVELNQEKDNLKRNRMFDLEEEYSLLSNIFKNSDDKKLTVEEPNFDIEQYVMVPENKKVRFQLPEDESSEVTDDTKSQESLNKAVSKKNYFRKPMDPRLLTVIKEGKPIHIWYVCKRCGKNMVRERSHSCFNFEEWCSLHKLSYSSVTSQK